MRKNKDVKMAAANDNTEMPFNPVIKSTVKTVMDDIKQNAKEAKKKKLPNVVVTDEKKTVAVRYEFTDAQKKKIGQDLAQRQIELVALVDEKKAVMASFTERVKAKNVDINRFSRQMHDGYEHRDHQCILILDFKKKEKRYRDIETKKIVKTEAFGPGDEQRRFL